MLDSHTHVNFRPFRDERDRVMAEVVRRGMQIINVGTLLSTSRSAVELAHAYPRHAFAAIGVHPIYVEKFAFDRAAFDALAEDDAVVAVGEIGLDTYHFKEREDLADVLDRQASLLREQIAFADAHDLPLMLHCRDAYDRLLEVLRSIRTSFRGQIHCFMGTWEQAQAFLELGFNIGFTGNITYSENVALRDVVRSVPLERIHIETDAPYLPPEPHRREKNYPWYVEYTAATVAVLHSVTTDEVLHITEANARSVFYPSTN